jgi:hypothetical protein
MPRPKGSPNKITEEQRLWAKRVDRMLAKASPNKQEGFDRLICRLLTEGAEKTKIALLRLMVPYYKGLPKQNVEATVTVNLSSVIERARQRTKTSS